MSQSNINIELNKHILQGWVKFPTGGESKSVVIGNSFVAVRDPFAKGKWLIWCESGTNSKVWMKEGGIIYE